MFNTIRENIERTFGIERKKKPSRRGAVVEGITEFLPISSTAHLLVTERLLGLGEDWEAFTVVIQLGAILAVVAFYFQVFWKALIGLPSSAEARRFALGLVLALLPSVVAGLARKSSAKPGRGLCLFSARFSNAKPGWRTWNASTLSWFSTGKTEQVA